jgi:hypothetical protein
MDAVGYGSTDDLGEYRVFGLAPGKYYLSATYHQNNTMGMTQDRSPGGTADDGYAPIYFPGTTDPAGAIAIDVTAGAVLSGTDIKLRKTRTVRIRGRVAHPAGEGLPPLVMIRLMPRDSAALNAPFMTRVAQGRGGIFEIRDLTPGPYTLVAQWQEENKSHLVRQPVDVGNDNLDDLIVWLTPGMELKGQVRIDGSADVNFSSVHVTLEPQGPMPMGRAGVKLKNDGSFALENVNADHYTVVLRGMPDNFYVKAIRVGDADGLEPGLDLTSGVGGTLDVLISPNGGQVEGTVIDPKGQIASGVTVVLVPDAQHRQREALFKVAVTDTAGHFSLKGINPGEFKLFAWEDIEGGEYQDPEFLKAYESQGENVTIREGSRENRQLKLITAEVTPKPAGY